VSNRTSFARLLPKAVKRTAGRTSAPQVPANIRVFGVELSQEERARIRHGLGIKLGKYETSIERVTIRVLDVNGPRGGIDKLCRIKVVLSGLPSVVLESRASTLTAAINGALSGTERAVRRSVQRRDTRPIQTGARGGRRAGD
jgi:ribosome-associated translation inhibitor RaiA